MLNKLDEILEATIPEGLRREETECVITNGMTELDANFFESLATEGYDSIVKKVKSGELFPDVN